MNGYLLQVQFQNSVKPVCVWRTQIYLIFRVYCHVYVDVHTSLISNFCRVLNFVCFLLGNYLASEFYMPTFRNTLSVPFHRRIGVEWLCLRNVGVTLLPTGSGHFWAKPFSLWIPLHFLNIVILHLSAYEFGTDRVFRNEIQTPGELHRRKHKIFRTRRKFENQNWQFDGQIMKAMHLKHRFIIQYEDIIIMHWYVVI